MSDPNPTIAHPSVKLEQKVNNDQVSAHLNQPNFFTFLSHQFTKVLESITSLDANTNLPSSKVRPVMQDPPLPLDVIKASAAEFMKKEDDEEYRALITSILSCESFHHFSNFPLYHMGNAFHFQNGIDPLQELETSFPDWLKKPDNLIRLFCLLAKSGAVQNFLQVFYGAQRANINLLELFKNQKKHIFKCCGQLLLIGALHTRNTTFMRWLITDKKICPNVDFNQGKHSTLFGALEFAFKNCEHSDDKEFSEILVFLHQNGADLNKLTMNGVSPAFICVGLLSGPKIQKLFELGASPYVGISYNFFKNYSSPLFRTYDYATGLSYKHTTAREGIEVLLSYGAGLVNQTLRLYYDGMSTRDCGALPPPFEQPFYSIEILQNSEIIFKHGDGKTWIYDVKALDEMFKSMDTFSDENKKRIERVCQSVLDAPENIFASGVVNIIKQYYEAQKAKVNFIFNALKENITHELTDLVISYLQPEDGVFDELYGVQKPK